MLTALNHPIITSGDYSTIMLSWYGGALHFFERVPLGGGQVLLSFYYFSYFLTFLVIFLMLRHWQRDGTFKVWRYQVVDLIIVSVLGVMLGAKIFYVLFYNLEFYIEHPIQIITNWSGMSSHGAAAGLIFGLWLYSRRAGIDFLHVLDQGGATIAVAPIFVRIANFLNGELYGRSADATLPWAMRFHLSDGLGRPLMVDKSGEVYKLMQFSEGGDVLARPYLEPLGEVLRKGHESFGFISSHFPDHIMALPVGSEGGPMDLVARLVTDPRHPSQFYQLLLGGVALLIAMLIIRRRAKLVGTVAASALMGYGITRFIVEFFREPDFQRSTGIFHYMSMGQILSLGLIAAGIGVFVYSRKKKLMISKLGYPPKPLPKGDSR